MCDPDRTHLYHDTAEALADLMSTTAWFTVVYCECGGWVIKPGDEGMPDLLRKSA